MMQIGVFSGFAVTDEAMKEFQATYQKTVDMVERFDGGLFVYLNSIPTAGTCYHLTVVEEYETWDRGPVICGVGAYYDGPERMAFAEAAWDDRAIGQPAALLNAALPDPPAGQEKVSVKSAGPKPVPGTGGTDPTVDPGEGSGAFVSSVVPLLVVAVLRDLL